MRSSRKAIALGIGLTLSALSAASAQKPKPEKAVKEMQKAEEKHEKEIAKAQKERDKAIEKAQREQKEERGEVVRPRPPREPKGEEHLEHESFNAARHQSEALVKGVHLQGTQRAQYEAIRKRYDAQYKTLEKQEHELDKAGTSDAGVLRQLDAARAQERAELRAMLTPAQQRIFDRNAARTHR